MAEDVRPMWSEEELDLALATLNADVPAGERALAKARAELASVAGEPAPADRPARPPRRRRRWAMAIATVAAVTTAAVVVPALPFWETPGAAAAVLNTAADRIGAADQPVGPGQFRYVETHMWGLSMNENGNEYLAEYVSQLWAPADWKQEWLQRSRNTGKRQWVKGSEADLTPAERSVAGPSVSERRAECGDFDLEPAQRCQGLSGWLRPTPAQVTALPDDPAAFHDWMRAETAGKGKSPDQQMVVLAGDMLRGGLIPAADRVNLYRALAMVPGLEIRDEHANLDGRLGVGLGVEAQGHLYEIIVDPGTGQFIGERQSKPDDDTVSSYTSVTTAVVDGLGIEPSK
ncbi:CU044_5270 family protein [Amycolatopsis sp. 195334CR]|uniref:CU044_5270 family protein n=1 Tax=Amycolatopsis sp. 195334CR TaxID=2814588 RepID=UPI001A8C0BB4|nr:CU044_5270 family protein [Amycolatopsis sp. 195334CR]MBN6036498.1 CU044_5270 family protein [Amycolatopsis sp. 195334CR]